MLASPFNRRSSNLRSRISTGITLVRAAVTLGICCLVSDASLVLAANPLMNVLIIQTDEHNFRTLGCYRDTLPMEEAEIWGDGAVVETPNIDSIAARGAICTSFYATSPVCTPSRAAFFTGRYPQNTGAYQNDRPLRGDMVTFAEVLRQAGYATGYAGKWHLDGPGKPQWGPDRKFGFSDNRYMFNRGHWKKFDFEGGQPIVAATSKKGQPNYNLAGADEKTFSTDWLCDRAADFVREHAAEPFCYHLSLPDPHGPNTVREPYDTMFENMAVRPPTTFQLEGEQPGWLPATNRKVEQQFNARLMTQYFGMVRCIDDNVGMLLDLLGELNLTENTVVVFTSDHGDLCYEHGRLNKGNPYEGSAKVPMIIAAPSLVPAGLQIDQAMGTVDFSPTLLSLLQQELPEGTQGRDLSEWFRKAEPDDKELPGNSVTFLRAASSKAAWVAAVTDRYKLIVSASDRPWLFDLEKDPHETENHIGRPENQTVAARLARSMLQYGDLMKDPQLTEGKLREDLLNLQIRP
ncbi:sulfatase family protein [Rhodopirellula bahusiensis]|uniref:sulfatase family protein n=1 Tax=Rhodopirellula bahusiensis TaxID=2014065 RepID=UPI003D64BE4C